MLVVKRLDMGKGIHNEEWHHQFSSLFDWQPGYMPAKLFFCTNQTFSEKNLDEFGKLNENWKTVKRWKESSIKYLIHSGRTKNQEFYFFYFKFAFPFF